MSGVAEAGPPLVTVEEDEVTLSEVWRTVRPAEAPTELLAAVA